MGILKSKIKITDGILHMQLPDEFKDKVVEVIVKTEDEITKKLMINSIKIDTTRWKFNREEIYGR